MGSVAETGTTVLLSSHLLADLERVCDYMVVLHGGRVQVTGSVDELVETHRVLVGPRQESAGPDGSGGSGGSGSSGGSGRSVAADAAVAEIAGVGAVIRASHTDRQSTLLVRVEGPVDPAWRVLEVTLEDLILAYLADGEAQGSHAAWGVPA